MSDANEVSDSSNPTHPNCILRLASAIHRFRLPIIHPSDQLSFQESFKTCSVNHKDTTSGMKEADLHRNEIKKSFLAVKISYSSVVESLKQYIPEIYQILISCKSQPQSARLDKPLLFSWSSGIEHNKTKKPKYFESEALMFELVMSIATYALCESNIGCEFCISGEFAKAAQQFTKAAGAFKRLGDDLLPNWMAKSKQHAQLENESLAETRVGVCVAFSVLHMAMTQQMTVSAMLIKCDIPNYALLGKLCLGVAEDLESFVSILRSKSAVHMARMDPSFLTLVTFQVNVQKALNLYFLARSLWGSSDYGTAIAALSEATLAMRTRSCPTGPGLPDIEDKGALQSLSSEVSDFRLHMQLLLSSWEKDNSLIYFDKVPPSVPSNKTLKPIKLNRTQEFHLEERGSFSFSIPGVVTDFASPQSELSSPPNYDSFVVFNPEQTGNMRERSDSDIARELHMKLNSLD